MEYQQNSHKIAISERYVGFLYRKGLEGHLVLKTPCPPPWPPDTEHAQVDFFKLFP